MTPLQKATNRAGELQNLLSADDLPVGKRKSLESELSDICENIAEGCLGGDPDDGIDWSDCPGVSYGRVPEPNLTTFYCSEMNYKLCYTNDEGKKTYDDCIPPELIEPYYDKIRVALHKERPIPFVHPYVIEIIPGVELHDGGLYGTLSATHYGTLSQDETETLRENLLPVANKFDDWFKDRKIETDGGDLFVRFHSGNKPLETETAFANQLYVDRHKDIFDTVRFYAPENSDVLRMLYYNPDSEAGGQMVQNNVYLSIVQEALAECSDEKKFWERLDGQAKQYLTDIDSPDFEDEARFFVEEPCDFTSQDSFALQKIKNWAERQCSETQGITM